MPWECSHPARPQQLGSGSCKVIICHSLPWEHSALGRAKIWWHQRDAPRGGCFSKGWRTGLCSTLQTLQLPLAPGAGWRTPVPVCWRRDGALRGSILGMHVTKSHPRSPMRVFGQLLSGPLHRKSLFREHHAGMRGAGSIPPLPPQPERVITSISPVLKKAQIS